MYRFKTHSRKLDMKFLDVEEKVLILNNNFRV